MIGEGTFRERCARVAAAGLDGVEIWLGSADAKMDTSDEELATLGEILQSEGLACSSVASTLGWGHPITSPDSETFSTALAVGRRQIEAATILGTNAILVVTGRVLPDVSWRQAWDRMVNGFQQLCDYAVDRGIRIGAETCPSLSRNLMTPGECTALVEVVDRPNMGIYLDVANVLYSGHPHDFVRELGPRLVRIHAKDKCEPDAYGKASSTYPGNGVVNWDAVQQACVDVGYDEWAVLEFPPPPGLAYGEEAVRLASAGAREAFAC